MTPTTSINAKTTAPVPCAGRQASDILRNILAFEAGIGVLLAAYPGLRHERVGTSIEWFLRVSRPLAGEGLPLKGHLVIDAPCDEDMAELLDAMAEANDMTLGRAALDAAMRGEVGFLKGKLDHALATLHATAKRDLDGSGLDWPAYYQALERALAGKAIELYPAGSDRKGSRYRPGRHIRDTVAAACAAASKASRPAPRRKRPRPAPVRASRPRPIRRRTYSALYE